MNVDLEGHVLKAPHLVRQNESLDELLQIVHSGGRVLLASQVHNGGPIGTDLERLHIFCTVACKGAEKEKIV